MTLKQLEVLVKLMRGDIQSLSVQAAKLVLVEGLTQTEAAKRLGAKPNTVNNGVKRYREANKMIKKVYNG